MPIRLKLFVLIVIFIAAFPAYFSSWNDSLTFDEVAHVGAGYSYIKTQEYRLNPEHPPLIKDLAGAAVNFLGIDDRRAFSSDAWTQKVNGQWDFGRELIYFSGNDADDVTRAAKLPMLLFFVLSAVLVFKWAYEKYGSRASVIALILFSFSPTVLAHSRLVTTDAAALFGVLAASYFFIGYLRNQNGKNFFLAGLVFGAVQLLKFSLFLLVPFFFLSAVVFATVYRKWKIIPGVILIFVVGFALVVWPVYCWHVKNYEPAKQKADMETTLSNFGIRPLADTVTYFADKPYFRALSQYGFGVLMSAQRVAGGHTAYFLGHVSAEGNAKYFPLMYLAKEPLAFWVLVLLALAAVFSKRRSKGDFVELFMLIWIVLYWVISVWGRLNIGVRHILPAYPFAIILVSGLVDRLLGDGKRIKTLLVGGLLLWYVFEAFNVYPSFLTYYNQLAGGPIEGKKIAVDSNLDWGQDLKRLAAWAEENDIEKLYLDYFGQADPGYYLGDLWIPVHSKMFLNKNDFLEKNPGGGYFAVSASFYMGNFSDYFWLSIFEPAKIVGNSIYVWDFRD